MDLYLTEELFRQMYFSKTKELQVYMYLIAHCDEEGLWEGSILGLADRLDASHRQIRTSLEKLESFGFLTVSAKDKRKTNIKLVNQLVAGVSDKQKTNRQTAPTNKRQTNDKQRRCVSGSYKQERQTNDKQVTNETVVTPESLAQKKENNNINNINNINLENNLSEEKENTAKEKTKKPKSDLEARKLAFGKTLIPYIDKYGKDMIREFFDYWSEFNRSKTKMLMETKDTWEVGKRLATWYKKKNEKSFSNGKSEAKTAKDRRRGAEITATRPEDYDEDF